MLEARRLDPHRVDDLSRARVIRRDVLQLPRWARFGGRSWVETGHRLVIPVVDAFGQVRSLRAWRVVDGETPKRLPPAGHRAAGLLLACSMGRGLLAGSVPQGAQPPTVLITEGEPDWLTWVTHFSDADEDAPAVLGVLSGSWSSETAARIPDGATVVLRTHHDSAGERYATEIAESLRGRCRLRRSRPPRPVG
jgi:hypothetical protein